MIHTCISHLSFNAPNIRWKFTLPIRTLIVAGFWHLEPTFAMSSSLLRSLRAGARDSETLTNKLEGQDRVKLNFMRYETVTNESRIALPSIAKVIIHL